MNCKLIMLESALGILPERMLCERLRFSNDDSFPKLGGMIPENELLLRSKTYCK